MQEKNEWTEEEFEEQLSKLGTSANDIDIELAFSMIEFSEREDKRSMCWSVSGFLHRLAQKTTELNQRILYEQRQKQFFNEGLKYKY